MADSHTKTPLFLRLGHQRRLDSETAHTIVQMIDHVWWKMSGTFEDTTEAKRKRSYVAVVRRERLEPAWKLLRRLDWLSLQRVNAERRISTVVPLAGLDSLRSLCLRDNRISNLQPLASLVNLRHLDICLNRVSSIAPLRKLTKLESLELGENPVGNLSALGALPKLKTLRVSTDQVCALATCDSLPTLQHLEIYGDSEVPSLRNFPPMPDLRTLCVNRLRSLSGVERFIRLENFRCDQGAVEDLEPLNALKCLTHLNLWTSTPLDMAELQSSESMRDLHLMPASIRIIRHLTGWPQLRSVFVADQTKCDRKGLAAVQSSLSSWDSEFASEQSSRKPNGRLDVVRQSVFDHYNGKAAFGVSPDETNFEMLRSEKWWLEDRIKGELQKFLAAEGKGDFDFPRSYQPARSRSDTLMVYSRTSANAWSRIVQGVQRILCSARHEWIIYFQSDWSEGGVEELDDFVVWIYPQKIMVAKRGERSVRHLMKISRTSKRNLR